MADKWQVDTDLDASLYRKGIHGVGHAKRVLLLAQELASLEQLPPEQTEILEFCALYHDIGRINDRKDDSHGERSVVKLQQHDFFGLAPQHQRLAEYIITNHCIDDKTAYANVAKYGFADTETAIYLLQCFKDCDNLDRFRIHDFDESYLRVENSHELIGLARELNGQN
jgi:putative nucleotidyltransferase with HDIG domain